MSVRLLTVIAILQGAFVVLLFLLVAAGHWLGAYRSRRREAHRARAAAAVQRWLEGRSTPKRLRLALDRLDFTAVSAVLQNTALRHGGREWERLVLEVRSTEWFERLCRHARSRFWWRRLAAARSLAVVGLADDAPLIRRLLTDRRPAVRVAAASSVARVSEPWLVRTVFEMATANKAVVRGHLLEMLSRDRAGLEELLLAELNDSSDRTRLRIALELAGRIAAPSLLDLVLFHASNPHLEVRIAATRSLGSFPHPQSAILLVGLLRDPRWEVRTQAASSLGSIGATEACDVLRDAMRDANWWVRLRAALALRVLGREGVRRLRSLEPDDDKFAFEMAEYVLGLSPAALAEFATGTVPRYDATGTDQAA